MYGACINDKDIALTFDDGPYDYLRTISDAFTNASAKATFFFNGNNWDCIYESQRIADVQYAYNAGHMIASHTWSHADLTTLNNDQIEDEMYRMEEAFSRILGIKPAFMRPPFGDYNSNIQSIAASRGQSLALWDWDTGDADGNSTSQSEALYQDIVNSHVKNAIVLQHETEQNTSTFLVPYAINLFKSNGYNLVTMADCLGVPAYQAVGIPQQQTAAWTCDGTPDPGQACSGSQCQTGFPTFSSTSASTGPTSSSASSTSASSTSASSTSASSASTTTPPPSGPTTTTANQVIHPNGNTAKCLTAAANSNNAAVEISDCVAGSTSQSWTTVLSGGTGTIQIFGNKCLDVTNGATADGTKMQIYTCSAGNANQQWSISGNTIKWNGHNDCLDNTGGVVTNGNVVQIWTCTSGPNQQWQLAAASSGTTPPPTSGGHVIHPGASSTTCLTAPSNTNGGSVVVKPCDGTASQTWTQNGNTLVVYSNMCLDVTNGSTANGNKMQIWACGNNNANQQFSVTSDKRIAWTGKGECLDLTGGSLTSGNAIQMWQCTDNDNNQVWNIV